MLRQVLCRKYSRRAFFWQSSSKDLHRSAMHFCMDFVFETQAVCGRKAKNAGHAAGGFILVNLWDLSFLKRLHWIRGVQNGRTAQYISEKKQPKRVQAHAEWDILRKAAHSAFHA
ncbi:hypothetical protein [Yeguia hominis]|uniref:Uncharacterized protein n=1 Tax=Yeguia hominis TaxID=2763662 RepID=A0A926D7P3_9FIRM|nr:hypothetical protein [Yeguia hominis]MBC8532927.1 hypothetical protein [Yeguia hominis]